MAQPEPWKARGYDSVSCEVFQIRIEEFECLRGRLLFKIDTQGVDLWQY